MATPRDTRVSSVLAWVVEEIEPEGSWLVVDDHVGDAIRALSSVADVQTWFRMGLGGAEASPDPPEGPFDGILVRLPKGNQAFQMMFHQLAPKLAPNGQFVVGGANDEGIRPVAGRIADLADHVEVVATRRHCRVVRATGIHDVGAKGELDAWSETVEATVAEVELAWQSWPSLFAHGRLDPGTRLLLEALPPLEGAVLDFACGAGVVGAFLAARGDDVQLTLSDVDALAVHAARINVPSARRVQIADGMPTEGGPWQAIVSNPPVHLGKAGHRGVLEALAATAPHRLGRKGSLWIVVQGTVPVKRDLASAFQTVERVRRTGSYAVWRAEPGRPPR